MQRFVFPILFFYLSGFFPTTSAAQTSKKDSVILEVYADGFWGMTPQDLQLKRRPGFIYNYSITNRPDLNLGMVRLQYGAPGFRTQFAFISGSYARLNLRQEAGWARNIGEASAGLRLSNKEDLWLDAGIIPSHIGSETYIGRENAAATRALISDQTPYYQTGIRLSYRPSSKWYLSMLALNGWQRITAPMNQFGANWGMQFQYTPNEKVLLNNSNFIGKVPAGSEYKLRLYSNSYARVAVGKKDWVYFGWDIGVQDHHLRNGIRVWNGLLAQWGHALKGNKWSVLMRAERIADPESVLYSDSASNSYRISCISANLDWKPTKQLLLRLEGNLQWSGQPLFRVNEEPARRLSGIYFLASYYIRHRF